MPHLRHPLKGIYFRRRVPPFFTVVLYGCLPPSPVNLHRQAVTATKREEYRLNTELDLQSLFGLHLHSRTHHSLRPRNSPPPLPPSPFGLIYECAIGQPRKTTSLYDPRRRKTETDRGKKCVVIERGEGRIGAKKTTTRILGLFQYSSSTQAPQ
jgi:hypothetical protein